MKVRDSRVVNRVKKEAASLIMASGCKGWTMAALATRSGMAKDTLYRVYPSKEALIKEIVVDGILEYQEKVRQLLEDDRYYEELLNELISEFAIFASRLSVENIQAIILEYPAIEEEITRASNQYYDSITRFFEKGQDQGFIRPGIDIPVVIRMINAFTVDALKFQDRSSISGDVGKMADCLVNGIKTPAVTSAKSGGGRKILEVEKNEF